MIVIVIAFFRRLTSRRLRLWCFSLAGGPAFGIPQKFLLGGTILYYSRTSTWGYDFELGVPRP